MFWQFTIDDLVKKIELKFSLQQVMVWQDYQNLLLTAGAIFGKGKAGQSEEPLREPTDAQDAQRQIDRLLGKIR